MKFLLFFLAAVILVVSITVYWFLKLPKPPPTVQQIELNSTPIPVKTEKKENFQKIANLQSETDKLLPLFGKMPQVPVFVKDEIINKEGSSTERGVAYTACENENQPTIFIKKVFYEKANQKQLINILKHELTHAYFCRQQISAGHDVRFRKKFTEVGGFGN